MIMFDPYDANIIKYIHYCNNSKETRINCNSLTKKINSYIKKYSIKTEYTTNIKGLFQYNYDYINGVEFSKMIYYKIIQNPFILTKKKNNSYTYNITDPDIKSDIDHDDDLYSTVERKLDRYEMLNFMFCMGMIQFNGKRIKIPEYVITENFLDFIWDIIISFLSISTNLELDLLKIKCLYCKVKNEYNMKKFKYNKSDIKKFHNKTCIYNYITESSQIIKNIKELCMVCKSGVSNIVILACGHNVICHDCVLFSDVICPACNGNVIAYEYK